VLTTVGDGREQPDFREGRRPTIFCIHGVGGILVNFQRREPSEGFSSAPGCSWRGRFVPAALPSDESASTRRWWPWRTALVVWCCAGAVKTSVACSYGSRDLGGHEFIGRVRRRRGVHGTDTRTAARRTSASPVRDGLRLGSVGGLAGRSDLGRGDNWALVERNT
jgi:hypothetical protein